MDVKCSKICSKLCFYSNTIRIVIHLQYDQYIKYIKKIGLFFFRIGVSNDMKKKLC